MLESIFTQTEGAVSLGSSLIPVIVAFILGGVISFTHKSTTKATPNFLITLTILPVLVQVIIFLVNGNLGTAFAVAGAFSLVRFRSMPGNSKEILSVFWAMAIGLGLGMGYIMYSVLITIIVAIVILLISYITNFSKDMREKKLKIIIPENLDYQDVFKDLFEKYTNRTEIIKVKTTNMGSMYELLYIVSLKNDIKEKDFIDEIRCRNGNMLVMLERKELSEEEL